ncbi:hypothetical protein [Rhodoblastus acidophilus]|nr:hypothetical protein [Rhodoblastus acidophilus]
MGYLQSLWRIIATIADADPPKAPHAAVQRKIAKTTNIARNRLLRPRRPRTEPKAHVRRRHAENNPHPLDAD